MVSRFDQTEINLREDCWFLIDTQWLNQWGEYMQVCERHDDDDDDAMRASVPNPTRLRTAGQG